MTYEYKCTACGHVFTCEFRVGQAPRLLYCPSLCLRRRGYGPGHASLQVSGGQGFVLKGPRWAKDGYSGKEDEE